MIEAPSGSAARYVPTVSVLPSENETALAPDVITGGSFTSVTVTFTASVSDDSDPPLVYRPTTYTWSPATAFSPLYSPATSAGASKSGKFAMSLKNSVSPLIRNEAASGPSFSNVSTSVPPDADSR